MLQIDHGFPRYFGWAVAMLLLVISVAILPQQEFTLSPKADYARVNSPGALPGIAFSDMIGALQRERFNTLLFTLMPTPEHRASLLDARLRTDTALDLFDDVIRRTATGNMSDQAADQIDEVMLRFSSLTRQRRQLDRLKLSWRDGFASYSTFIISVLDLSQALDVDKHASLTTSLRGWLPFTFLGDTAANDALIPKNWTIHNWSFPR